ncbi:Methionine--tRNA ligase cytoplasmic [Bienertia sinuspersici]
MGYCQYDYLLKYLSLTIWQIYQSLSLTLRTSEHRFLQLTSLQHDLHALSSQIFFLNQQAVTDTHIIFSIKNSIQSASLVTMNGGFLFRFLLKNLEKSNGIGALGDDGKKTNIPIEVWRYYLTSVRDLQAKLNNELADNLGNFTNRKGYNLVILDVFDVVLTEMDTKFGEYLKHYVQEYVKVMEKVLLQLKLDGREMELDDEDIERVQRP